MQHVSRTLPRQFRNQRGLTLPMVALLMFVFLAMASLAVDLGMAYTARTSAQHAADAAALAGAYTLANTPTLTGDALIAQVTMDAAAVANSAKVLNYPVTVSSAVQGPTTCDTGANIICVDTSKSRVTAVVATPVDTYFGKIANWNLLNVKVKGVAEAAQNAIGDLCLKPFYLANDSISGLPPASKTYPENQRCNDAMAAGKTILVPNAGGNPPWKLSDYATAYIQQQTSFTTPGTTSRYINDPSLCLGMAGCPFDFWNQSSNPSQFGLVDFSEDQSNAGQVLPCSISSCMQECPSSRRLYQCGQPVAELKTGDTRGQVETPLKNYIGQVGSIPSNYYEDVTLYNNSPGGDQSTSPSLISVIIWDCKAAIPNGTQPTVTVLGYAKVFVNKVGDNKNQSTNAFLISAASCGGEGTSTGPGAVPIRLVNTGR